MNGGGREDEREEKAAGKGKISLFSVSLSVCLSGLGQENLRDCVQNRFFFFFSCFGEIDRQNATNADRQQQQ